ncbi:hypothetical protein [Natrinema pallidum]|uniref:hypothetical protein n=1 Tax=Natrinema pallidum TaxID=69527 RepID=UPI0037520181
MSRIAALSARFVSPYRGRIRHQFRDTVLNELEEQYGTEVRYQAEMAYRDSTKIDPDGIAYRLDLERVPANADRVAREYMLTTAR